MAEALVEAPRAASARAYLRGSLPAAYRDGDSDFAMRFVGAFEEVLDPVVALLDSLHAHFDVELAPEELVACMSFWLGLELEDGLHPDPHENHRAHRALVRDAKSITRRRGTREGLERMLRVAFPGLGIRVEDSGRATSSDRPGQAPTPRAPWFRVVTETPALEPEIEVVLRRMIGRNTPVHVRAELRVGEWGEVSAL